jgi:hypothetical protein
MVGFMLVLLLCNRRVQRASPANEYRKFGSHKNLLSLTSHDKTRDSPASMGRHNDQVASTHIGGFKYAVRGVTVRYVADGARNADITGSLRRGV